MLRNRVIRGILCCVNPKINLCNDHYVCGYEVALFSSFAEIEKCLTNTTCKIKGLPAKCNCYKNVKDKC